MFVLLALVACEVPPRRVQDVEEVDAFLSQKRYGSVCVALKNRDDEGLRTYAAQQLAPFELESVPRKCLCEALYDPDTHRADLAVARGVAASRREDLARCLAPAASDPAVEERTEVVEALGRIDARDGHLALEKVLSADPDPLVRAAAARALRHSTRKSPLAAALAGDADPRVRAASALALEGTTDAAALAAVGKALAEDADNTVRAAALKALVVAEAPGAQTTVCKALMEDADPVMRLGAAQAFHGSKRQGAIDCLARRLTTPEDNPAVRSAVMDALGASPSKGAADALCELIHPVMRLYVTDAIADETAGVDIVKHQNDRDWERSYECVQKAIQKGGLSCYARNHLGSWFEQLGGKASVPLCPGMSQR
jgi:HEAT repeat protein